MATCEEDAAAVNAALLNAMGGPVSFTVDGMSTTQQRLADLIELDKYMASKCASVMTRPSRGLRFTRLILPGTV